MEVEVMGREEEEGGRAEGGAKPPNFEMERCFPDRRKISCVSQSDSGAVEKHTQCIETRLYQ